MPSNPSSSPERLPSRNRAFSLIEALATVGMVGILGLVVTATISPLLQKTESTKLADQVGSLNQAVSIYRANGGTVPAQSTAMQMLAKLKTAADSDSAQRIAGFRGSFIDPRLQAVWQSSEEAASSKPRVIWNPADLAFSVQNGGEAGIKEFRYDDSPTPAASEHREMTMKLASNSGWIWDFEDVSASTGTGGAPSSIPTSDGLTGGPKTFAPQLYAPEINPATGVYPLVDFSLTVAISNPNPTGSSRLTYSVNDAPWRDYEGPFEALPGTSVRARAVTEDPTAWRTSPQSSARFDAVPYQLEAPIISPSALGFHHVEAPQIEVTLYHHNPTGVAILEYRLGSEETWQAYETPLTLEALDYPDGVPITARVKAVAAHYLDSEKATVELAAAEPVPLEPPFISLSHPAFAKDIDAITVTLTNPNPDESSTLHYRLGPLPGEPGVSTDTWTYSGPFTVRQADWHAGFGVWAFAKAASAAYLDSEETVTYASAFHGLFGGHLDLDTSTSLSPLGNGSNDAHTHNITGKYNLTGIDFFAIPDGKQVEIHEAISGGTRFKILAINGDLSPGMRLSIRYSHGDVVRQITRSVAAYDDIPIEELPVLSLDGVLGSYRLESFELQFNQDVISNASVIPTNTGDVKKNLPGKNGEWRNGSLTLHAVAVNDDGSNAFTVDRSMSAGGEHGVATSGLLWEGLVFWHWDGKSYHQPENRYVPGDVSSIKEHLEDDHLH